MRLVIPPLSKVLSSQPGSRNVVKHLLHPKLDIEVRILKQGEKYWLLEYDQTKICLTDNEDNIPDNELLVLLSSAKLTAENYRKNRITAKKWLKHPGLHISSPETVNQSWKGSFNYKEEDTELGKPGLREPQLAALHMIMGHLKMPLDAATVVMPTGTGKTETMLSALIASRCEKLLVTVPSDALRDQLFEKFFSLGLLKEFGVVMPKAMYPIVGIIRNQFPTVDVLQDFIRKCNVVITTMSWITNQTSEVQAFFSSVFSHFFIDEAHHVKANSWNEVRHKFAKEKIVQFTATPFRNDGKRLDGKIISNFPLRKAQEQGYYKKIEFIPIREYVNEKADIEIARVAVNKLRSDISNGFNHILMARCSTKVRADEIYQVYKVYEDLNPVVVYSGISNYRKIYDCILRKEAKIIVCVDMLGEGFDLPELKIAAFHDIRKSLPITLQLAGRFTRTKYDEQLGNASFIANVANLDVRAELTELYAEDADWNEILADSSFNQTQEKIEFKDFMNGFKKLNDSNIPFQNIRPKLSTVVYKNKTNEWFPSNFKKGIAGYDDFEFKFFDINREQQILIIVTGRRLEVDWVKDKKEIHNIQWDIIIAFWETEKNLLFINSSDNSSLYSELAQALIGENAELIRGIDVFRSFHNVKRVKLQNVGLRQFYGKNIRFRMMVGSDVAEALSLAEQQRGEKAFVMGNGFEEGEPVNIGASYKGRIWTKLIGDLMEYKEWCTALGKKLTDASIDSNQILRETLIPEMVTTIPERYPAWIDWDVDMYLDVESKYLFLIDGKKYDLSRTELALVDSIEDGRLLFSLKTDDENVVFELSLFENNSNGEVYPDFKIVKKSSQNIEIQYGAKKLTGEDFFKQFIPTIWFADGSALTGNEYVELKQSIGMYPRAEIIAWDWTGVDLRKESQGVSPKLTSSIQYKVIQELLKEDFDIIYDDDYSGEVADVVAIKQRSNEIDIKLYHLKFALDGIVSNQIKNFYEVCGQAQKSTHWKHKPGKELINHLLRREVKIKNGNSCSRIEKGAKDDLIRLLNVLKNEMPVRFEIFVVQPGVSKLNVSDDILMLLGVTSTYMKEFADIHLNVIASA